MKETADFKSHLMQLGYSTNMVRQLPGHIQEFLTFIQTPINKTTPQSIVNYYHYLQERPNKKRPGGLSECYINHHVYALKLFFSWQQSQNIIQENPMNNLDFPQPKSQARAILSQQEITHLYESCETPKERAILALFYGCGLRRSEGEKLNIKDVNLRSGLLYVREGKGKKRRVVPMSDKVVKDLKTYLYHYRFALLKEPAFLTGNRGQRSSGDYLNKRLKAILQRAGIVKEVTLHGLRHSIATHLLESGLGVNYVRDFLGHQHLESTQIYTRVNNNMLWNLSNT